MLPSIALVNSVEFIRDGGSLGASFQGANGAEYLLFFKVNLQTLPDGKLMRSGYEPPIIIERHSGTETKISWKHSRVFLDQMRTFLREEADRRWLEIMYATAGSEGQLIPEMRGVFGVSIEAD